MRASTFFALFIAVLLGFAALGAARYFGWFQTTTVVQKEAPIRIEGPKVLRPGRAIDIGCGTGTNCKYLLDHGWDVTGVDFVPRALAVAKRKAPGAKLLIGGHRLTDGPYAKGWFHEPTVFGDCNPTMRISQEEIFGPVVSIIPISNLEEAIDVANGVPYGLSASIYTRNVNRAFQAIRDLFTGIVYVNAPTIGAETHLPFGGTKKTGNGHREAAVAAIDFYTEWKTLYIDYSDKLQRAQIDNAE